MNKAFVDERSRSVLFVVMDQEAADRITVADAPGVITHASLIRVGDIIDTYCTGWNRAKVSAIKFTPSDGDMPGWHRCGTFTFTTSQSYLSVRVDGRDVVDHAVYVFKEPL